MQWTRKLSLRRKITLVIMINTFAALCAAGIAFAGYGIHRFKGLRLEALNTLANVLGTNSTASLVFKDPNSARDILQALTAKPHMLAAVIYDQNGKPFAVYHRGKPGDSYSPPPVGNEGSRFTSDRMTIFQKITFGRETVGTVFIEGDNVEYNQLLDGYLIFFGLIVAVVSLGAFVMAARLQRPISDPILNLAWTAKMVTATRDYSIRAGKQSEDEVGVLIDGFNEMLAQIQKRDAELRNAGESLERRVEERTLELEQEVADRQRAQEALHDSEERIRLLLDSTAEAIYGIDREGNCTFCNPATLWLLGYQKPEDLLGKHMHRLMHHTHADGTPYAEEDCNIYASLRTGEGIHSDEGVFWRADGTSFHAEFWAFPIRKEGEIVGAVVTFLDISERMRAEEALRTSEEKYRSLVSNIPDVVWTVDAEHRITFVSPNIERMLGYTVEELHGLGARVWLESVHPDDLQRVLEASDSLFTKGQPYDMEYRVRRKNGEWFWAHTRAVPTYEKNGTRYADGLISDITQRKQSEEGLRKSQERYRVLFDAIGDVVFVHGISEDMQPTHFLQTNDVARQRLGYSQDEFASRPW
jgi:PAS domain S-box-containing protein